MAERTSQSFSEQEQRLRDIAQQGTSRIQRSRDEGVGKMAAVHTAAVQASKAIKPLERHLAWHRYSDERLETCHCARCKGLHIRILS